MNAMLKLPPNIEQQISALKDGWMFVGKTFQDHDPHCDECGYCEADHTEVPYGEGAATLTTQTCALGRSLSDKPEQCPVYAAHMENEHEDQNQ